MSNISALTLNNTQPPSLPFSAWKSWFFVVFLIASLSAVMVLKSWGILVLCAVTAVLVVLPLIMRLDNILFWSWLTLFPLLHYDPLHLSRILPGEKDFIVPLFLMITAPGALISFVTRWRDYKQLLPVIFPLFSLAIAFLIGFLHFKSRFVMYYFVRDLLGLMSVLYLTTVCYRLLKDKPQNWEVLFNALFILGFLNGVACIVEYVTRFGLVEAGDFLRPMGLFGFPVIASLITLMTLSLGLFRFFNSRSKKSRLLYGISIPILIVSCITTLTKTNILLMLPLLGLWGLFLPGQMKIRALMMALGFGVLIFLWEVLFDHGHMISVIFSRFSATDTFDIRQQVWQLVAAKIDFQTFLFGKGWYSGSELLAMHNYNYKLFPMDVSATSIHPHNSYIKYTYELGIFGLGMLVGFMALMIRGLILCARSKVMHQKLANLAISSVIFAVLFDCLTGIPIAPTHSMLYFVTILILLAFPAGWIQFDRYVALPRATEA